MLVLVTRSRFMIGQPAWEPRGAVSAYKGPSTMSQFTILMAASNRKCLTLKGLTRVHTGRRLMASVGMALILVNDAGCGVAKAAKGSLAVIGAPVYESVEDPAEQRPTRILYDGGTFSLAGGRADRDTLRSSDLGFPIYFERVDGGVRVRGQPIVFPSSSRNHFDFEDFSCSATGMDSRKDVFCRSKAGGQLFRSTIVSGGLIAFDIGCFNRVEYVCHYELQSGHAIRPANIQRN
jgi:hypothetical protein